jgi:hypothetical protein
VPEGLGDSLGENHLPCRGKGPKPQVRGLLSETAACLQSRCSSQLSYVRLHSFGIPKLAAHNVRKDGDDDLVAAVQPAQSPGAAPSSRTACRSSRRERTSSLL